MYTQLKQVTDIYFPLSGTVDVAFARLYYYTALRHLIIRYI